MTVPAPVREALQSVTGGLHAAEPVGGGCIAHATRLDTEQGRFFLKWGEGATGETFAAEAEGLGALRAVAPEGVLVPEVFAVRRADAALGYLLLEWIVPGAFDAAGWRRFGEALAALHRADAPVSGDAGPYGFASDNFIGRLPQRNRWHTRWPDFFREERLRPQIERARTKGRWRTGWDAPADRLLGRLDDLLPARPHPALLHGDLWSGNALAVSDGRAALIDPAAYVGDRETDLAMTELFGGFATDFYAGYRAAWPLDAGCDERREVYNLYHLVNHLNHFGAGYAGGVERVLRRFG